jgi:hypothetical protein
VKGDLENTVQFTTDKTVYVDGKQVKALYEDLNPDIVRAGVYRTVHESQNMHFLKTTEYRVLRIH